ncbi:MAG: hypothetical protein DPW09_03685 [Anaerolineae bacterium]|nr:hypothetical protein [Anaerolineae bacterium]
MMKTLHFTLLTVLLCLGLALPTTSTRAAEPASTSEVATQTVIDAYSNIPLHFEPNQGQVAASEVGFISRGRSYTLFATPAGLTLALHSEEEGPAQALQIALTGANPRPPMRGLGELPGVSNYLIGDDPAQWRTNVPNYGQVKYEQVYPGIDLLLYGNQHYLEYDFTVEPGADPSQILMNYAGAQSLELDEAGDLIIHLSGGEVRQKAPVIYQEIEGTRHLVEGGFVVSGEQVQFQIGQYDPSYPLIIDPLLVYSTFLGGSGSDTAYKVALNSSGEAFIVGTTYSADFPSMVGAYDTSFNGGTTDCCSVHSSAAPVTTAAITCT